MSSVVVYCVASYVAGILSVLLVAAIAASSEPAKPKCPAVLKSGETCREDEGHEGPHRTYICMGSYSQAYVWEDPKCGLHTVGFFPK